MRGVFFGDYNTADDWDLILNAMKLDPPSIKRVSVSVDGRDGEIDLSETLTGEVKYNNREASFTFLMTEGRPPERADLLSRIYNLIHGQKLNIKLPDDPDHYLVGRCTITDVHTDKAYSSFKVSANCEPYRYDIDEVVRSVALSGTARSIVLSNNGRRTLIPTVTVTGSASLVIGSSTIALSAGTYKLTALVLRTGTTTIQASGSGSISFTYREAVL